MSSWVARQSDAEASCVAHACPKKGCAAWETFSCLSSAQVGRLTRDCVLHDFERGEIVFRQGSEPHAAYCIHSGSVRLSRLRRSGREVVVGIRRTGDLAGFPAALAGLPYNISAQTLEPSVICMMPRATLAELLAECPPLALRLLHRMAAQCSALEDELFARDLECVKERTARLLVGLAPGGPAASGAPESPTIAMTREDMALLIGTTRETLSRVLNDLSRRGIVGLNTREIRIRDLEALERLVDLGS